MSTTILEPGTIEPSARNVIVPSTPSDVKTASVLTRFTARCSCTRTVATLFELATKRTPPAGTGLGAVVELTDPARELVALDGDALVPPQADTHSAAMSTKERTAA